MQYDEIYSRFYTKMTDPNFYKLSEQAAYEQMSAWLHNAVSEPYIRSLFSTIELDDDLEEITFTMKDILDDNTDNDFVIGVFAEYMVISWMRPKVDDALNFAVVMGGKEEKMLQANYKANVDRLNSLEKKLQKRIRDHGYKVEMSSE